MNNKQITAILFSVWSVFSAATKAEGNIVVEFSEVSLTSPTLLDGTNYFEPYGLSFEDTTYWGTDSAYIGSGIDNVGISPMIDINTIMTLVFIDRSEWIKIDWVIITNHTLTATAYNIYGVLLDEQTQKGTKDINHGSFTFSNIGTIKKITFSDEYSGVGRLEFEPIPEPCTLLLFAIGGIYLHKRRI